MMAATIWVTPAGVARLDKPWGREGLQRLAEEAERLRLVRAAGQRPAGCSDEIIDAPARPFVIAETPRRTVMTAHGPRQERDGLPGQDRVRCGDAFDVMHDQAVRAHAGVVSRWRKANAHLTEEQRRKREPAFEAPFTPGQEQAGRDYALLSERVAASGVKCSSIEALRGGSGNGDREEAMLADFQRLRSMHRRIGDGLAKEVRRQRPSATGGARSAIRVRTLVDQVCIGGLSLDSVLEAHGWKAGDTVARAGLRDALCGALNRMQGYDLAKPQNVA